MVDDLRRAQIIFALEYRPSTGAGDPVLAAAQRLGLANKPGDQFNAPWRYWTLRYLAALAFVADYEHTAFGREQARAALETLAEEVNAIINELRHGKP